MEQFTQEDLIYIKESNIRQREFEKKAILKFFENKIDNGSSFYFIKQDPTLKKENILLFH